MIEVGGQGFRVSFEYYITYAVWTWGFVGASISDGIFDVFLGDLFEWYDRFWIVIVFGYSAGCCRGWEEGFG